MTPITADDLETDPDEGQPFVLTMEMQEEYGRVLLGKTFDHEKWNGKFYLCTHAHACNATFKKTFTDVNFRPKTLQKWGGWKTLVNGKMDLAKLRQEVKEALLVQRADTGAVQGSEEVSELANCAADRDDAYCKGRGRRRLLR